MPTVSVSVNSSPNQEFEAELGETLFDECEKNKIKLPHGCLAGSCGSCRIEVLEGEELLKKASPIEQNTIDSILQEFADKNQEAPKNVRLSCRAKIENKGKVSFRTFK